MLRLAADPAYTDQVLADGGEKARAIARPNMDAVKDILGLLR
jgi:tryptophanyl-tRNA synthetase